MMQQKQVFAFCLYNMIVLQLYYEAQVFALDLQTCETGGYCVKHGQESQFNGPSPSYVLSFGEKD